ncbi:hypothetical protein KBC99_01990 [Candidatus Saccharibacteria bacterium]|nr:hypothetical protein [Candidatus Saccharibacteria bacterium]
MIPGPPTVTMLAPNDLHVHLRDQSMMEAVLPFSTQQFDHILPMPNTDPKLTTADQCLRYRYQLLQASRILQPEQVLMTLYLTDETTPQMIHDAARAGVRAVKYYPHGGTTRSGSGLRTPHDIMPATLQAIEDFGLVLCLHAEVTEDEQPELLLREKDFIPYLDWLVENFPNLKIVVEHVSDRHMLVHVLALRLDRVGASITVHHPFTTYQMAIKDPHCWCMPVAKTPKDAQCLREYILLAKQFPQIWFGSDSAPHLGTTKLGDSPAFGAWTSPVAVPVLWDYFYRHKGVVLDSAISAFESFMTRNGANFFGLPINDDRTITLRFEEWSVPEEFKGIIPWRAGKKLHWRVDGMSWFGAPDPLPVQKCH